jgi:Fanconi anemia group M protein
MALTEWTIEVDDRERAGGVVDALAAYPQVVVAIGRLPLGDYLPGGGVIVERKTAADLVLSIRDQRLFDQAARLTAGAARPVIILEGDPLAVRTAMHKNAILGALTWLTTIQGIPLLPSTGPARTAELLVTLARQQQQGWRGPTGVVKPKAPTPREQQLAVLAALPGVGPVLAARLLDHFGGLRAVFVAAPDDLAAVPGVGAATATRIAGLLR